jgi:predicted glutamine amidotransferase
LVFAHNGTVRSARDLPLGRFRPIGSTDSEHAFCAMLAMPEPVNESETPGGGVY